MDWLPRCRGIILLHGLWAGWAAVLLLNRDGGIQFQATPSALGIIDACARIGYPKQADYFWYGLTLLAGLSGAVLGAIIHSVTRRLSWNGRFIRWPSVLGFLFLAAGASRGFLRCDSLPWLAWLLVILGWALPWLDRGWYRVAPLPELESWTPPAWRETAWWAAVSLVLSWAIAFDSCLHYRPIDGMHEGSHLVDVQSWLAGDLTGLDIKERYGILYSHSIAWWMSLFGMTVSVMRGYFIFVQAFGMFIHLLLLRVICRDLLCVIAGAWLMLTLSPAPNIQFGWANSLRTALPLAALWLCWRGMYAGGRKWVMTSGAVGALAWLYSSDYGAAGIAACLALMAVSAFQIQRRDLLLKAAWWCGAAGAALLLVLAVIFGPETARVLAGLFIGEYGFERMVGYAALPLPAFPWWDSWRQFWGASSTLRNLAGIWAPGLLCAAAIVWLGLKWRMSIGRRSPLLLGLIVFTLLSQIPVLARPSWQIATSMSPAVLLFALFSDLLLRERGVSHRAARLGLAAASLYACWVIFPMLYALKTKYQCVGEGRLPRAAPLERLGTVRVAGSHARELAELVQEISKLCPPEGRVYLAAHRHGHLLFLADRAALGPYSLTYTAATKAKRRAIVARLEQSMPPLALVSRRSIDLGFALEHPEEWAWLNENYRPLKTVGEVSIWVPKDT